jgi:hypothetical protein
MEGDEPAKAGEEVRREEETKRARRATRFRYIIILFVRDVLILTYVAYSVATRDMTTASYRRPCTIRCITC